MLSSHAPHGATAVIYSIELERRFLTVLRYLIDLQFLAATAEVGEGRCKPAEPQQPFAPLPVLDRLAAMKIALRCLSSLPGACRGAVRHASPPPDIHWLRNPSRRVCDPNQNLSDPRMSARWRPIKVQGTTTAERTGWQVRRVANGILLRCTAGPLYHRVVVHQYSVLLLDDMQHVSPTRYASR